MSESEHSLFGFLTIVDGTIFFDEVGNHVLEEVEFVSRARGDYAHVGHESAELGERETDAAAGRVEQHGLARLDAADLEQEYVGGDVAVAEGGRLSVAHLVRDLVYEIAVDHQVLGPGEKAWQTNHPVANLDFVAPKSSISVVFFF